MLRAWQAQLILYSCDHIPVLCSLWSFLYSSYNTLFMSWSPRQSRWKEIENNYDMRAITWSHSNQMLLCFSRRGSQLSRKKNREMYGVATRQDLVDGAFKRLSKYYTIFKSKVQNATVEGALTRQKIDWCIWTRIFFWIVHHLHVWACRLRFHVSHFKLFMPMQLYVLCIMAAELHHEI